MIYAEAGKVMDANKRDKDTPPSDDICSICFDNYDIPCKTNCGHWFCANCVLLFWAYRSKLRRCKCPICSQSISKLTPEESLNLHTEDKEVVEALTKIQGYNSLFVGGVHGWILSLRQLPVFFMGFCHQIPSIGRMFYIGLYEPDNLILNYIIARAMALMLTISYDYLDLNFLPGGLFEAQFIFQCCTIGVVLFLCAIGLSRRIVARSRRPRRRGSRTNPISGPKNPPDLPPIQDQGPLPSGLKNPVQRSDLLPIQDKGPLLGEL